MLKRKLFRAFLALVGVLLLSGIGLYIAAFRAMGDHAVGERLARMTASPQWKDDAFFNVLPRIDGPAMRMTSEWLFGGSAHRTPAEPIKSLTLTKKDYDVAPASGLRVTWLGHSTLILEIDNQRVLIDPVWGERASPLTFMGPLRWFDPPLPLAELPKIDAIVISHDHYDHLDYPTVEALADMDVKWFVPLGIGADLIYWGVREERIVELDWWGTGTVGDLTVTCTPARHFSGRGLTDQNESLWAGWAITSDQHRVYYSGDTAMFDGFVEIGKRLGPFDLTMIEVGAYNAMWADVHLGPEQAVRAHRLVRGNVFLPVHWGLFDLALHGWTEPIERVLAAAKKEQVEVRSPPPGGRVEPLVDGPSERWWPDVPWENAEVAPCPSSGVETLNGPFEALRIETTTTSSRRTVP